ncbi:hypothetical protein MTO96_018100 [Rhipicephalus appendiculatus]
MKSEGRCDLGAAVYGFGRGASPADGIARAVVAGIPWSARRLTRFGPRVGRAARARTAVRLQTVALPGATATKHGAPCSPRRQALNGRRGATLAPLHGSASSDRHPFAVLTLRCSD